MNDVVRAFDLRVLFTDAREDLSELERPHLGKRTWRLHPGTAITLALAERASMGNCPLDRGAHAKQVVGQLLATQRGAHRHHPTAEIDADGGWDDRLLGRDDRTDSGAASPMHVRHGRYPLVDE